ncbi:MAG: amidohydrolase [Flavobacteriaceae bacterium]|nr:amidohydrolase [Flavobacteriaceae bacterium]
MKTSKLVIALIVISIMLHFSCNTNPVADFVLLNGKIATVDKNFSIQEAVVIKGNSIIFVGKNSKAKKYIGDQTNVIELDGKLVLPGLIDAHAHTHDLGDQLSYLNINNTTSYQQIIDIIADKVKITKPGEWIVGGRWDQNNWDTKTFPIHDELSKISPDNPVYLKRVDGNSAFVNQKALEIAGITKHTPSPDGGVITKKNNGEPTGVLINKAMNLVIQHIPKDSEAAIKRKYLLAVKECNKYGLTGIHEAGVSTDKIDLYKKLIDNNELNIRMYAMLGDQTKPVLDVDLVSFFKKNRIHEYGHHMLSVKSIKIFFDGALGSRGAAFYSPYDDDSDNTGLLRVTPEYITKVAKAALEADIGVNTHCIGIRGNRLCLDAYEKALKDFPNKDHRFRIEHAQVVRDEDIAKYTSLGVIPSMQLVHSTSDMGFIEDRIGKVRAKGSYAWRSFIDAGNIIACGSDFPVEQVNPLLGIYAAVTRQDANGLPESGWNPEQRMTIEEAIKGFTIWAAYAAFQEDILGSIEKGKLADFTILDKDILSIIPKEILTTTVAYTIVGGKIVYQKGGIDKLK